VLLFFGRNKSTSGANGSYVTEFKIEVDDLYNGKPLGHDDDDDGDSDTDVDEVTDGGLSISRDDSVDDTNNACGIGD
jgi:hypothetical protein